MINVLIPELPGPQTYYPLLLEMQRSGQWTNDAPMITRFERALAHLTRKPCVAVANGTIAIEFALRHEGTEGDRVLIPSVCFVGAAQAIRRAGMVPVLCDVDDLTWSLTPQMANSLLHAFDIVLPVCVFGITQPSDVWAQFQRDTGKRVVIDGGGTLIEQPVDVTTTFSLHATKCIGVGEGGVVCTTTQVASRAIRDLANFGAYGTNGKMSGVTAAIGMLACDPPFLHRKLTKLGNLRAAYGTQLPMGVMPAKGSTASATIYPVLLPTSAARVQERMQALGVETKRWYWPFLHDRAEFNYCARMGMLPVARDLSDRLLGLPLHSHLESTDIAKVCECLAVALR